MVFGNCSTDKRFINKLLSTCAQGTGEGAGLVNWEKSGRAGGCEF